MAIKTLQVLLLFFNTLLMIQGIVYILEFFFSYLSNNDINLYSYFCFGFGLLIIIISFLGYCIAGEISCLSFYLGCILIVLSYQFVLIIQILVYNNKANIVIISETFTKSLLFICCGIIFLLIIISYKYRSLLYEKQKESSLILGVN